jgi:enoyl-CoA hydratase
MTGDFARVTASDGITTICIDRPPVNALSSELLHDLLDEASRIAEDQTVRCVILTGAGEKCFVAGADISEAAATPPERAGERTRLGQHLMLALETLPVPVVVAINGVCLGGGCELAMAGDIRIAADHAKFGQPEVNLGIIPGFGGTQRLPRLIGSGNALDLLLTGRTIDAQEALRLGLVSRVVPANELADEAQAIAKLIAGFAPGAVWAIKRAVRGGGAMPLATALQLEYDLSCLVRSDRDAMEGLQAFVEKRPAKFS